MSNLTSFNLGDKDWRMKYLVAPFLVFGWFFSSYIVVRAYMIQEFIGLLALLLLSPIIVSIPYVFYKYRNNIVDKYKNP